MSHQEQLNMNRRNFLAAAGASALAVGILPGGRILSAAETAASAVGAQAAGRMKFALCNEMFENRTIAQICPIAAKLGYQGLELAPYTLAATAKDVTAAQRAEIRKAIQDSGLQTVGLHWLLAKTTGYHITTLNDAVFKQTKDYFNVLIDLCHDLNGSVMVIGSPKQRSLADGQTYQGAWKRSVELFRGACDKAKAAGITLCIEPLAKIETDFINTVAEGVKMMREINHPAFKVHLDVKAMSCEGKPSIPEIIRSVKAEDIGHFHVNDPNLYGPGMGDVDYGPIATAIKEVGWNKWLSVEVFKYDPDPETIARKSMECLKKYWA
ncbi:MAG: sugar phosphate isomerase/epimerase [Candidatus Sumerlaeota bacterium]|nr:sugar phosphate isomerase/epimerase [Candidatus Sumerlaeota bacterium]